MASAKKKPDENLTPPDGNGIEVRNGRRYLVPGPSPIREKILGSHGHWKMKLASREEVKIRRIAWKRSQQAKKGWPADKSPI
jgi:hypothetical protein